MARMGDDRVEVEPGEAVVSVELFPYVHEAPAWWRWQSLLHS